MAPNKRGGPPSEETLAKLKGKKGQSSAPPPASKQKQGARLRKQVLHTKMSPSNLGSSSGAGAADGRTAVSS